MQLHQVLRMISNNVPIVLFDSTSKVINKGLDKASLNIDLYEEEVFQIACGSYDGDVRIAAIHIMLRK